MNECDDATPVSRVMVKEQRSTRFTGIYSNTTKLEDIIHESYLTEMTELVYANASDASRYLRTLSISPRGS